MAATLVSFLGVAVLLSLVPGPATALVVRSAAVHGRREAFHTVLGNSTGILGWALCSVLGISALVLPRRPRSRPSARSAQSCSSGSACRPCAAPAPAPAPH